MSTATKINVLDGLERSVTITVPKQGYKSTFDKYLLAYKSKAKFDGFRSGKVPDRLILGKYRNQIHKDSINDLVETNLQKVLSENNLKTASPPKLSIDSEPTFENDFVFTVKFEVIPSFEIEDLSKMDIEEFEVNINDSDIDEVINNIQRQHMKWENTKEKAVTGNKVIIDYDALVENNKFEGSSQKDFTLIIDDAVKGDDATVGLFNQFYTAIKGETAGIKKDFIYKLPENFPDKNIAGKEAKYSISIKSVHKGIMPKIDDDFFSKFGLKGCDEKEFRKNILKHMEQELEQRINSHKTASINNALVEKNKFEIPKYMIESEKQSIVNQYEGMMKKIDDSTKLELERVAEKRAKLNLIYMKIAEQIKISISEKDVYEFISKKYPAESEVMIEKIKKDEKYLNQVKNQILENDIINHIKEKCKLNKIKKSFSEVMN
ncbi:MAG: trigger factor [Pseudomonadota bacterium]|nr:trigger factor [Pseudomonadota bacterium]|tara:strand:- start:3712 stop:5016 length:1305 start_codon:yes stop_codon:yes gene_type:complete